MDTPNKPSSGSSALWVIALSLAVIAGCLVVLVTRQQRSSEAERSAATEVTAPPAAPAPERRLPKAFVVTPGRRETPEATPAVESVRVGEVETPAKPPEPTPSGPEPIVSRGLAPLTYLSATNSPDSKSPPSIRGRVTLNGAPPLENLIEMDPLCGKLHGGVTNTTHLYAVSKDGGLADVFVYISGGLKGKKFRAPEAPVVLDQKGCFFEPYVFGLMTGQKLSVKNSDPVMHTVHVNPQPDGGNKRLEKNYIQNPGAPAIGIAFSAPENFLRIRCNVHPWMFAYAGVVDHPFFAVTDANGNFVINNVPPGDYTLTALHRKANASHGGASQKVTVADGETTTVNFTIQAPPPDNRIAKQK